MGIVKFDCTAVVVVTLLAVAVTGVKSVDEMFSLVVDS